MAKTVKINGVTYESLPRVDIPLADNSGDAKFYDTSSASTIKTSDVRTGVSYYDATGPNTGSLAEVSVSNPSITTKGQTVSVPIGIHNSAATVQISPEEQAKIIASNIKSGVTILGVPGGLSSASIEQDPSTKVLRIS